MIQWVGNLISGSSAFSKTSLNIWKFTVHVLLKPGLENFEHYFTRMWDECNWAFFGIAFLWDWNENWRFPVLWPNKVCKFLSHLQLFATPRTVACQAPLSWNSPGKDIGVSCCGLLQGIFLTQGLNSSLLHLLSWQVGSLPLATLGSHNWVNSFQSQVLTRSTSDGARFRRLRFFISAGMPNG